MSLLTALVVSAPADAEVEPIDLRWSAPSDCPTAEDVISRVELGPDPHSVRAEGTVVQVDGRWSLSLRIEGYGGEDTRTLDGESCEALADATALLIQVATGPERPTLDDTESPADAEPQPEPEPEPARSSVPDVAPPRPASPSAPELPAQRTSASPPKLPLRVHARAVGFVQLGELLPGLVAGGVGISAGVSIPWVRVEARGTYVAPRELDDPDHPGVGIDVDGWGVGGSGCGLWGGRRLFVPLCAGAQVGRTRATAFGLEDPGVGRGLWAQFVTDVALGVRVHPRVALTAGAEALVSLRRPSFRIRGFPPLFQTGPAAGRMFAGIELGLWSAQGRPK